MTRQRLLQLVILSGLALVIVAVWSIKYTSQPSFCHSCHEMQPMYQAWQTSAHREVNCLSCHSDPGVGGLLRTKMKGLGEVYKHFTGTYERPITITADTEAFSARCLRCHQDIFRRAGANLGPHNEAHRQMGMQCARCHQPLVHNPEQNTRPPSREICVGCHGTTDPGKK